MTDGEVRYCLDELMSRLKLRYNNEAIERLPAEPTARTSIQGRGDTMFGKFKPGHHSQRIWPTLVVIGLIGVVLLLTM